MRSEDRERRQLEARKQAIIESLPSFAEMMRGSLVERSIKCGKESCRCAQGHKHPTTYLSVSFKAGKTVQITVPKNLLERVRGMVRNYSEFWAALEQISEINRQLLRKRLLEGDPHADHEP
jgi:hypothetical protein